MLEISVQLTFDIRFILLVLYAICIHNILVLLWMLLWAHVPTRVVYIPVLILLDIQLVRCSRTTGSYKMR